VTTETARLFSPPSEELVRHATRQLTYPERLTIQKMSDGVGNAPVDVYSFPDVVNTLFGTRWDRLETEGTTAGIVWVDAATLAAWLRDVIGDVEFADAVAASLEGADHYKAQIDAILPLFRERVEQYRAVLRLEDETQDEDGA
jgi:hypothetical protein